MGMLQRSAPTPQPPETWGGNMAAVLPSCFNSDRALPRLLFLVSPTCAICVSGAMSATHTVLSLPPTAAFRLYILWLPVLEQDTPQAAEQVQGRLPTDDRVGHFWDQDLLLSRAYHRVLQLGQRPRRHRIAWDVFLLYGAGVVWQTDPPLPAFWMHQLFLEEVPKLEAMVLRRQLERLLRGDAERIGLPA